MLGKLFSGKKAVAAPTSQDAISKLRETEDMLIKKQAFLEKKVQAELDVARSNANSNKRVAMQALKRKKTHEKQLQHLDGVLSTIEFQRVSLENASTNADILRVMADAGKAMKAAHNDMSIDEVQDLMEDIAEQQDIANEIAEAISNPVGFGKELDESDLLQELEELQEEEISKKLVDVGPTPHDSIADKLPVAPSDKLPARPAASKQKEDDDLAELADWAA